MQVKSILPCVCIDHEPNAGDSVFYGMPQLKVAGYQGTPFYTPYCPHCGRGGMAQYRSAYLALSAWNKMVEEHRKRQDGILLEPARTCGEWISDEYGYNHCSECGFEHDEPEYVTPYCPNCGANMDLEGDSK